MSGIDAVSELLKYQDLSQAKHHLRFFKCFDGGYGDNNDKFCGARAGDIRSVAKKFYKELSFDEIERLLRYPIHEVRVMSLVMLTSRYDKADIETKEQIIGIYLQNTRFINNWDLVDISAYKILGRFCYEKGDYSPLRRLCESEDLWEQRISVVANLYIVKKGEFAYLLEFSKKFLTHKHDLIHKAVGWILREMGKSSFRGYEELIGFLEEHKDIMPRTMLRYAIERLTPAQKTYFMKRA